MSKDYARQMVTAAIKKGFLQPAHEHDCVDCGAQALDYDHRDYNKPLEVEPVCRPCNKKRGPGIPFEPVKRNGRPRPAQEKADEAPFRKVVEFFGCRKKTAEAIGISKAYVSRLFSGNKPVPAKLSCWIQHVTNDEIKASFLRPDIFGNTAA